uniref:Uncharacterized protein n=1 Tax=Equus asinus TaxID=9793 RepID=A0A9L0JAC3_EQUAS
MNFFVYYITLGILILNLFYFIISFRLTHFLNYTILLFISFSYCSNWIPTVSMWGAVDAVGLVWATNWQLILTECHISMADLRRT